MDLLTALKQRSNSGVGLIFEFFGRPKSAGPRFPEVLVEIDHSNEGAKLSSGCWKIEAKDWCDLFRIWFNSCRSDNMP